MVNNYPKYAGAISYQKADESNNRHFYNAEVTVDPTDDSMTAKLTKDGEVISELPNGGGSSDFSTADVTLNLTVEGETLVETALDNAKIAFPSEDFEYKCAYLPSVDNKCTVLLYKGSSEIFGLVALDSNNLDHATIVGEPVTTGNVVWNSEDQSFIVTGNGTITATLT